jgi:hypothetical protein
MIAGIAVGLALLLVYFDSASLRYVKSLGLYFRLFEFNKRPLPDTVFRALVSMTPGTTDRPISWSGAGRHCHTDILEIPVGTRDVLHAGFWLMTADLPRDNGASWYISWAAALPFSLMLSWCTDWGLLSSYIYLTIPHEPAWALLVEYLPLRSRMGNLKRRPLLLSPD